MNGINGNFIMNLDVEDDDDPFGGTINILRTKSNGIGPQQVEVLQVILNFTFNSVISSLNLSLPCFMTIFKNCID